MKIFYVVQKKKENLNKNKIIINHYSQLPSISKPFNGKLLLHVT